MMDVESKEARHAVSRLPFQSFFSYFMGCSVGHSLRASRGACRGRRAFTQKESILLAGLGFFGKSFLDIRTREEIRSSFWEREMIELLVETTNLPVDGREFSFDEQRIWADPIAEYHLPYRIAEPFSAMIRVVPHADGCTVEGTLRGSLFFFCDRCAEEFTYPMTAEFHEFEAYPGGDSRNNAPNDVWWVVPKDGLHYLDVAGFLWEQFQLALPEKPLCAVLCRGVCAECGANKNLDECRCAASESDSRLAAFRSMKLS